MKKNWKTSTTAIKHADGTDFDADNIDVNARLEDNKYLDLFYYSEIYTDESSREYRLILTGEDTYKVSVKNGEIWGDYEDATIVEISGSTDKLTLTCEDLGITNIQITKVSAQNYWEDRTGAGEGKVPRGSGLQQTGHGG